MANTTFNGPVRAEGGFKQITKNATTGAITKVADINGQTGGNSVVADAAKEAGKTAEAKTIQDKIDNPSKRQEQQSSISNTEKKINGSGTGLIITKDGYILTCYHVIADANEIKISTPSGH